MQKPLFRVSFDSARLLCDYPPKLRDANKIALFELAYEPGSQPQGTIEVTRWRADVDEEHAFPSVPTQWSSRTSTITRRPQPITWHGTSIRGPASVCRLRF